jgi:hypothetical protein
VSCSSIATYAVWTFEPLGGVEFSVLVPPAPVADLGS